ncbi:MAG: hypothetical protein FWC75_07275 [Oscillospiraceae bacterium]|nr:hypothetical protein [Oscillospiraceae bacterium]
MAIFRARPKTSAQKASQARLRIVGRMLGCGYLVYIVVTYFIRVPPEEMPISAEVRYTIIVFFLAAAAALIFLSIKEFFRNYKVGFYNETFYTSDPGIDIPLESSDRMREDEDEDIAIESDEETMEDR